MSLGTFWGTVTPDSNGISCRCTPTQSCVGPPRNQTHKPTVNPQAISWRSNTTPSDVGSPAWKEPGLCLSSICFCAQPC